MEATQNDSSPKMSNVHHDGSVDLVPEPGSPSLPANDDDIGVDELRERFTAMESKISLIDQIFGIQQVAGDTSDEDSESDSNSVFDKGYYHTRFLEDSVYFMNKIRESHQYLQNLKKKRRMESAQAEKDNRIQDLPPEKESTRQISTAAFLKREPATVAWVSWPKYLAEKGDPEESLMTPIEAVDGDPEELTSHTYMKITALKVRNKSANTDSPEQAPLPERVKIHSNALHAVFLDRFEKRLFWRFARDRTVVFLRPFKEFIYNEKRLREHLGVLEKRFENWDGESPTKVEDDTATKRVPKVEVAHEAEDERPGYSVTALLHLRCLMQFMDDEIKPRLDYIQSSQCNKILFHDLWHLFKPGDEIIDQTEKQAYRIIRVQTPQHRLDNLWLRWRRKRSSNADGKEDDKEDESPTIIHCTYIDFDGKQFGPVSVKFSIPSFSGLKDIKLLPVYPLRFAKDIKLRETLIARGKMLLNITKFKPMYYAGFTIDTREEIDSQVVVDFSEALADEKRKHWTPVIESSHTVHDDRPPEICSGICCVSKGVRIDKTIDDNLTEEFIKSLITNSSRRARSLILSPRPLEEVTFSEEDKPTDEELVVMTYRAFGFVLRTRKWAQLDLTFLKYENADARNSARSAFERLELPGSHRQMVKSLVTQHFRDRQAMIAQNDQTDLVRGKGKGLILLLHGAPGVGKTTTAEGVAELFEKPLFQITCGDLGTTAREVEQELEKNFALASRWGCILLLDEADVFLSARERKDFERNGLVAVFLRVLEYYAGILFLTTNRIDQKSFQAQPRPHPRTL
ncbi:hypothetical protein O1611_g9776 [Lasiodiplodia mahajangana]|uniref:Uncharacterized protein n=1 Tax=Lasiodiplodia mahajangana TaxID=1108764 RepID=A0ACC2J5U0_9PEZI|nr:hypothetical protein O1611_g9776 [Lasiodiplodia mahajangana]